MGFLGDLFKAGTGGTEDAGRAFARAGDDFAQGDFDAFTNETENVWDGLAGIPGTSFSTADGLYRGFNGDLDWNPYSYDNSVWDQMAGGSASEDPSNRRTGRTIGTIAGGYFTGAGLGSLFGSSTGGAAASGALWGGAQAAGTGGDRDDIGKAALMGGLYGGGGQYIAGLDAAGGAGVTDPALRAGLNSAIGGAGLAALTPGSSGKDIGKSAMYSGVTGYLGNIGNSSSTNSDSNPYAVEYDPNTKSLASTNQSSKAPWANQGTSVSGQPQMSVAPYASGYEYGGMPSSTQQEAPSSSPSLMDQVTSLFNDYMPSGNQLGNLSQGILGIYQANRQRKQAKELMNLISGRRNAYGEQMRSNLMARDAASGRRSNYAGREQALQASLAELDSRNAPTMMSLQNRIDDSRGSMLQDVLRMGSRSGLFDRRQNLQPMSFNYNSIDMPSTYSLQNQIDPTDWNRYRRPDQFGG